MPKLQTFHVTRHEDVEGCYKVLESVRRTELNRVSGNSVIDSEAMSSEQVNYMLFACRDEETQQIIGCVKLTNARAVADQELTVKEYNLTVFPDELIDSIVISTRLAVLPAYRNSNAAFQLMSFSFLFHVQAGGQGMLGTCEPSLYPMYRRLGMRAIGAVHNKPTSGYRLPLIAFPDFEYLKEIGSPAYRVLRQFQSEQFKPIQDWFATQELKNGRDIGLELYNPQPGDEVYYEPIIRKISEDGIKTLLKNAVHLYCKADDIVIPEKDGGRFMGIVYSGELSVQIKGTQVAKLKQGGLFGEIALVINDYRTACIKAASDDTEVIILSKSALNFSNEKDELAMWKNLARILARKLVAMNTPN